MSVSRIILAGAVIVSVVFFIVVGALRLSSQRVAESVTNTRQALESIHIGQELETGLLRYNRLGNMYIASGDPEYLKLREEAHRDIEKALRRAQFYLHGEAEARMLQSVESEMNEYLKQRGDIERRKASLRELLLEITPELNRSLERIRDFMALNRAQAIQIERESVEINQNANGVTALALSVLLVVLGVVFFALRKYLLLPLTDMYQRVAEMRLSGQETELPTDVAPELRELSLAINQMTDRLRRERKQQLAFVSGVAHDLRNPLTSIKGYLEVLSIRQKLPEEAELRRLLGIVFGEAGRIEHMLNDLLDATRVEAGQFELELEKADLVALVKACAEVVGPLSEKHRIRFQGPENALDALIDPHRIRQVIENLLSNAMKYSPLGGEIRLTVADLGESACIEVLDYGIGIPLEEQRSIFEPFRRAEASRNAFPGIGLGLSVSKRIVEAHGGRIELKSDSEKGTRFRVILPKAIPEKAVETVAKARPKPRAA